MPRNRRIRIIPHPKPEPDLDQIVLAVLAMLDDEARSAPADREDAVEERRAS